MEIQPQEIECSPDKEKLHQIWLRIKWRSPAERKATCTPTRTCFSYTAPRGPPSPAQVPCRSGFAQEEKAQNSAQDLFP